MLKGGLASPKMASLVKPFRQCTTARRVPTARAAPASLKKTGRPHCRSASLSSRGGGEAVAFQAVTSVTAGDAVASSAAVHTADAFAWGSNWWPVHVLAYLDPSRPTPVELLGMQLVLWRDAGGTWRCFRDSCPHRRVPLSEGRVEGGELVCSYHGWRFNEGGACTAIPQAPDAKSLAAATASPRSCVTSFPTKEAGGLLWVWPEASPSAAARAQAAAPTLNNAFNQPPFKEQMLNGWYMRELPYDFDVLLENIADPSHVPFSHHAVMPIINRNNAPPLPFTPVTDLPPDEPDLLASGSPSICSFEFMPYPGIARRIHVYAPGNVTFYTQAFNQVLVNLMTPVGPGRSKVFVTVGSAGGMPQPNLLNKLVDMVVGPAVVKAQLHVTSSKIYDGDTVFLNAQSRWLRATEQQAAGEEHIWVSEYFMPMSCDRAVVGARKWLHSMAGGGPAYPADAVPATQQVTREQLLDRLNQHTKHCPDCRAGLEFAGRLVTAGQALQAASFFALCCLAGTYGFWALFTGGLPSLGVVAAAACCWAASWLWAKGEQLQKDLTFTDYVHADIP